MYVGLGVQMIGLFINSSVFVKDYSRKFASVHKLTESGRSNAYVLWLTPRDRIELPCEASLAAFGAYRC